MMSFFGHVIGTKLEAIFSNLKLLKPEGPRVRLYVTSAAVLINLASQLPNGPIFAN